MLSGWIAGQSVQHSRCFSSALQPWYGAVHCVFLSPGRLVPSRHDQELTESGGPNSALTVLLGGGLGVT